MKIVCWVIALSPIFALGIILGIVGLLKTIIVLSCLMIWLLSLAVTLGAGLDEEL